MSGNRRLTDAQIHQIRSDAKLLIERGVQADPADLATAITLVLDGTLPAVPTDWHLGAQGPLGQLNGHAPASISPSVARLARNIIGAAGLAERVRQAARS